jgi:hypothetical protein
MNSLKHSGENIAERVGDALKNNGFSLDKLLCCVRDDAKNMQSAANNLETKRSLNIISYIFKCFQCFFNIFLVSNAWLTFYIW